MTSGMIELDFSEAIQTWPRELLRSILVKQFKHDLGNDSARIQWSNSNMTSGIITLDFSEAIQTWSRE